MRDHIERAEAGGRNLFAMALGVATWFGLAVMAFGFAAVVRPILANCSQLLR
jgi:hypothetical protein